ncbi:hypothetical protein RCF27_12080 [Rhodococcus pyridinivorans]|uniref:hypothetical protein n=2 Tax=Rhodococcus pyridinivorans TaxID=103816 RepID=UPI00280B3880|nr:hypothetical protein [Rhodococcus pyridinivorans]WMM75266.1 hypothetical protein RCF27_12080 [Rhodococcus pyridinivorans]
MVMVSGTRIEVPVDDGVLSGLDFGGRGPGALLVHGSGHNAVTRDRLVFIRAQQNGVNSIAPALVEEYYWALANFEILEEKHGDGHHDRTAGRHEHSRSGQAVCGALAARAGVASTCAADTGKATSRRKRRASAAATCRRRSVVTLPRIVEAAA